MTRVLYPFVSMFFLRRILARYATLRDASSAIALEKLTVGLRVRVTATSGRSIEGIVQSVENKAHFGFIAIVNVGGKKAYQLRHSQDMQGKITENVTCHGYGGHARGLGTVATIEPIS